jgi:hypothetical protein
MQPRLLGRRQKPCKAREFQGAEWQTGGFPGWTQRNNYTIAAAYSVSERWESGRKASDEEGAQQIHHSPQLHSHSASGLWRNQYRCYRRSWYPIHSVYMYRNCRYLDQNDETFTGRLRFCVVDSSVWEPFMTAGVRNAPTG